MSTFTIATLLLANFGRQSAAITRPNLTSKTGGPNQLALKLRGGEDWRGGGGASHLSDVAIYGGAGLLLIDGAIEYVYPELALTDAKDSDCPVPLTVRGRQA